MYFDTKAGLVLGRSHLIDGKNRQDAFQVIQGNVAGESYLIGFISDGCGEGTNSEFGAYLKVNFACNQARSLISQIPLRNLNAPLYGAVKRMLSQVLFSQGFIDPVEEVNFIKHHLLATLIGFIIYKDECLLLSSGDGTIVINNDINLIDQKNRPSYIAYQLIDPKFLPSQTTKLPDQFDSVLITLNELSRLAIGSDAWHDDRERDLLPDSIWNLGENPRALNRKMRMWSNTQKMFRDDAVLITVEVQKGDSDANQG